MFQVRCPWCGESADVFVDVGAGAHQSYVEDCAVCCRPCVVTIAPDSADRYVSKGIFDGK